MATASQTGIRKHVVEIKEDRGDGGAGSRSYRVPVGSEIRIAFYAPVIPGAAHKYVVDADGSVAPAGLDSVEEYGVMGSARTDVILTANSLGDGTAKIKTVDDGGTERNVTFFSFDVVEAPEED
jgi:hypothetical protein